MARVMTVGVPWDSYGREEAAEEAAQRLRRRGLVDRLAMRHDFRDWGELVTPSFDAGEPADAGGLLGAGALAVMVHRLADAVAYACDEGYAAIVYGGDSAVLLGCLAGAGEQGGPCGLVVVSGGEHALPLAASPDGAAAGSAVWLALGGGVAADGEVTGPLGGPLPLCDPARLAMLGACDDDELRALGVPSLRTSLAAEAGADGWFWSEIELREQGLAAAAGAAALRAASAGRFWLHIDLDVLDPGSFPAAGRLRDGGLSWSELVELTTVLRRHPACSGFSVCGYDVELDPDEIAAFAVADFVERLAGARRW